MALLFFLVTIPGANAQELDTAIQAFRECAVLMGQMTTSGPTYFNIDTTYDLRVALNSGIRQVSVDIPWRVRDSVTITSGVAEYAMDPQFIESADFSYPFDVWRVTPDGRYIYGLKRNSIAEFTTPTGAGDAFEYAIMDSSIVLNPADPNAAKVHIEGRGQPATMITHSKILFANVGIPRTDRKAVVYWAVYVLASARQNWDLAARYLAIYNQFVARRTGRPQTEAPQ